MKPSMKKSLSVVLGTSFAATMAAAPVANADTNPFGMQDLESGYMQLAEGKCGEGMMNKSDKAKEAKCGEGKAKEAKCGEGMKHKSDKAKEAKCGEGKCGEGMMNKSDKAKEAKCGDGK